MGEVLRLVRGGEVVSLILLLGGQAEVMEFSISRSSALVGRMIKDLDFPKEVIITTIVHKGEIIIPHGSDIIQAHDRVIVLTQFEEIERIREPLAATRGRRDMDYGIVLRVLGFR